MADGIKIERVKNEDRSDTGMVHITFENGIGIVFPSGGIAAGIHSSLEDSMYRLRDYLRRIEKRDNKNLLTWDDVLRDPVVIEELKITKFLEPLPIKGP
jgi:hypothetical protein